MKTKFIFSIFLVCIFFSISVKKNEKNTKISKIINELGQHPKIREFSAQVDCSHPWGTQFLGLFYTQWFGNELNKNCYERNRKKKVDFSIAPFERRLNYERIPKEVIKECNLSKEILDFSYVDTQKKISELQSSSHYRNILMLQPIAPHVVYAEFKVKYHNKYFPINLIFYVVFDKNDNIKKVFQYTEFPRPS
jgi:hypothetical protein